MNDDPQKTAISSQNAIVVEELKPAWLLSITACLFMSTIMFRIVIKELRSSAICSSVHMIVVSALCLQLVFWRKPRKVIASEMR
jgi:K+ transporter